MLKLPISADEVAQEEFTLAESMKDVEQKPEPSAPAINDMLDEDEQLNMAIARSLEDANREWNSRS